MKKELRLPKIPNHKSHQAILTDRTNAGSDNASRMTNHTATQSQLSHRHRKSPSCQNAHPNLKRRVSLQNLRRQRKIDNVIGKCDKLLLHNYKQDLKALHNLNTVDSCMKMDSQLQNVRKSAEATSSRAEFDWMMDRANYVRKADFQIFKGKWAAAETQRDIRMVSDYATKIRNHSVPKRFSIINDPHQMYKIQKDVDYSLYNI